MMEQENIPAWKIYYQTTSTENKEREQAKLIAHEIKLQAQHVADKACKQVKDEADKACRHAKILADKACKQAKDAAEETFNIAAYTADKDYERATIQQMAIYSEAAKAYIECNCDDDMTCDGHDAKCPKHQCTC